MFKIFRKFSEMGNEKTLENSSKLLQNKGELKKTNILTIDEAIIKETICGREKAYFKAGIVYEYLANINEEDVIGRYDNFGKVYDRNGYEIGEVSICDEYSALIQLNRLGDLRRLREALFNKSDEQSLTEEEKDLYYPMTRKMNIAWTCVELNHTGGISDLKTYESVAKPEYLYEEERTTNMKEHQEFINTNDNKNNLLGYGACFVCLQYENAHGKYADFYCPIGETFKEP